MQVTSAQCAPTTTLSSNRTRHTRVALTVLVAPVVCALCLAAAAGAQAASPRLASQHGAAPDLGSNVVVLSPTMPQAAIQSRLDAISTQQVPNQFGSQRYAIFFEPGTYGSAAHPLDFQVGYYTEVAGQAA
jgi:hypothetical protein